MAVNFEDELTKVDATAAEKAAGESDAKYDKIITDNNTQKDSLLTEIGVQDANGKWNEGSWADKQTDIQNEQTDFAIKQIELQKERAEKDYIKEQSGAYVDWQKASNNYGANAERMASNGLTNTGFSESSQVSMYNNYQNRITVARESFQRALVDYDNQMTQARIQNNAALAQIAADAFAKRMEVIMTFVQHNNTLLVQKTNANTAIKQTYYQNYLAVLDQIVKQEQFNEQMALQREQFNWQKEQAEAKSGGSIKLSNGQTVKRNSKGLIEIPGKGKVTGGSGIDGKAEAKDDGKEKDYPVDTASLNACGLSGASAAKIEAEIQAGRLVESVVNGKLTYRRVFNGLPYSPTSIQTTGSRGGR